MRIEFIAIGSELLYLDRVDTNSAHLQEMLRSLGLPLVRKAVIGDNKKEITAALSEALERSDAVIISGGLGPTVDDLTVETVTEAFGRKTVFNEKAWRSIADKLAKLGRPMNEGHRKQAYVVEGADILENSVGQAPGEHLVINNKHLFLLPGVPAEFISLIDNGVYLTLKRLSKDIKPINRMIFKFAAIPESDLDIRISTRLSHLIPAEGEEFIITTKPGIQTVSIITHLIGKEFERRKAALENAFAEEFKDNFYASEDLLIEEHIVSLLTKKKLKLATAESCTGGLLASRITDIPGASQFFLEGLVTYDNKAKKELLNVKEDTLINAGAVSTETALEMCRGLLEKSGADMTVSITGIAGPDGGSKEKPVGTAYIGIADRFGSDVQHKTISGTRRFFKEWVTSIALNAIRLRVLRYH